jgi:hypothetical protein
MGTHENYGEQEVLDIVTALLKVEQAYWGMFQISEKIG